MRMPKAKSGFSLVQVLIGAGLLGILALVFNSVILGGMRGQQRVQNAVDFDILKTSLNQVFHTNACHGALRSGGSTTQINFAAGTAVGQDLVGGATYPNGITVDMVRHGASIIAERGVLYSGRLKVTDLRLSSAVYDGEQTISGVTYKAYSARFFVEVERDSGGPSARLSSHELSVRLLANGGTGLVERCADVGGPALPAGTVCGGYVTRYPGNAWCSECTYKTFGCGVSGGSCPSGYSAMPASFVTINGAENTWLCIKN